MIGNPFTRKKEENVVASGAGASACQSEIGFVPHPAPQASHGMEANPLMNNAISVTSSAVTGRSFSKEYLVRARYVN
jgi:hypothetical protein